MDHIIKDCPQRGKRPPRGLGSSLGTSQEVTNVEVKQEEGKFLLMTRTLPWSRLQDLIVAVQSVLLNVK